MKLLPEILMHPHIPKPLHGVNPRSIMGQEKWDTVRQGAYRSTDYHCIACGVAKSEAKKYQWLEAHEYYKINYKKGEVKIIKIVPLCHYCHNFIHSGRLAMIIGDEKTEEEVIEILQHGFKILAKNKLSCFPFTLEFAESLGVDTCNVVKYDLLHGEVEWSKWHLIYEGKKYYSKDKNIDEWRNRYA